MAFVRAQEHGAGQWHTGTRGMGWGALAAVPAPALPKKLPPPHTGIQVYVTAESL